LAPSDISKKLKEERLKASKLDESRHEIGWGSQSKKNSNLNMSHSRKDDSRFSSSISGIYDRNQTKSRFIRPDRTNIL
jgi:hypothetical protein